MEKRKYTDFEEAMMGYSGKSIEYLRETPISQVREDFEKETGRAWRALGGCYDASREKIEKDLKRALR